MPEFTVETKVHLTGQCPWCGLDLDPDLRSLLGSRVQDEVTFACPVTDGGCGKSIRVIVIAALLLRRDG